YEGHHEIVPLSEPPTGERFKVDVVGPICESGDFFCQDRPLPAEILIEGGTATVIRKRQTLEDVIAGEL
ncbi:MAG: diaminopimelate decarboxylase, partial [Verrucomicrobiaceae bacterium]